MSFSFLLINWWLIHEFPEVDGYARFLTSAHVQHFYFSSPFSYNNPPSKTFHLKNYFPIKKTLSSFMFSRLRLVLLETKQRANSRRTLCGAIKRSAIQQTPVNRYQCCTLKMWHFYECERYKHLRVADHHNRAAYAGGHHRRWKMCSAFPYSTNSLQQWNV